MYLNWLACLLLGHWGFNWLFPIALDFSGVISHPRDRQVSQHVVSVESSSPTHRRLYS